MATKEAITAAEVSDWFRSCRTSPPSAEFCEHVAARFTKMKWPSDPDVRKPQPVSDGWPYWWEFDEVTKAAKSLRESVPQMLRHWETRRLREPAGYDAIYKLSEALTVALPYIDFPLGPVERASGQKKPKDWHIVALVIWNCIMEAPDRPTSPSVSRKAVMVRVIRSALHRMGYKLADLGGISQHLTRWNARYGLTGLREPKSN
jgi:hypothetical protein